jgi:hypothetical protein
MRTGSDKLSSRGQVDAHPGASMLARTKTRNENENENEFWFSFWMVVFPLVADQAAGSPPASTRRERACPSAQQVVGRPWAESAPRRDGGVATVHGHADFPRVVEPR